MSRGKVRMAARYRELEGQRMSDRKGDPGDGNFILGAVFDEWVGVGVPKPRWNEPGIPRLRANIQMCQMSAEWQVLKEL
jgi:hypothetical protein